MSNALQKRLVKVLDEHQIASRVAKYSENKTRAKGLEDFVKAQPLSFGKHNG